MTANEPHNPPLTERGRSQVTENIDDEAKASGLRLHKEGVGPDLVFSSPFLRYQRPSNSRCLETAKEIAEVFELPVFVGQAPL